MLTVIVDTNVVLHFKRLDDLDWSEILPGPCIFVIPPAVISELDGHKTSRDHKVSKRSRQALPWLEKANKTEIRPSCHLLLHPLEPRATLDSHPELDPGEPDDRIVATALEFRDSDPDSKVLVLSGDTGPRLKARHQGLEAMEPESRLRKSEPRTEDELELERLRRGRNQEPKLLLLAPALNESLSLGPLPQESLEERVSRTMAAARDRFPGERYSSYVESLERWAREYAQALDRHLLQSVLPLQVENAGGRQAKNATIFLKWKNGPTFQDEAPELPDKPNEPGSLIYGQHFGLGTNLAPFTLPENFATRDEPRGPHGVKGAQEVSYDVPHLSHGLSIQLPALRLEFPSFNNVGGFKLSWTIHADDQSDPTEGELNVRASLSRDAEDFFDEMLPDN